MANRSKRIGKWQATQVAKLKKQAKQDGVTFVGRYTVPHGKKHQQAQTAKQVEQITQHIEINRLTKLAKRNASEDNRP